jgi:hypothetical protein
MVVLFQTTLLKFVRLEIVCVKLLIKFDHFF